MALLMAAATPVMPISPMPRAPRGLRLRVRDVEASDVDVGDVGVGGDVVLAEV